ncbi:MAG: PRC-barrel domain-containing protein, partial [Proteobacteria bacterium]|nr:PRC-barrel domain-containing protein [Pseudomonadota bacterium]
MKRTPLLFAALTPFAVAAGAGDPSAGSPTVDKQKLQDSVRVSEINEMSVTGQDGRIIGEIEDVVLDTDGRIAGLVVKREIEIESDLQYGDQRRPGEDIAEADADTTTVDAHEGAGDERTADEVAESDRATLDWSQVSYDRNADAILLTGTATTMSTVGHDPESASAPSGRLHAGELIGMDVNL